MGVDRETSALQVILSALNYEQLQVSENYSLHFSFSMKQFFFHLWLFKNIADIHQEPGSPDTQPPLQAVFFVLFPLQLC